MNRHPQQDGFFKTSPAKLVLKDGSEFSGKSPDWQTAPFYGEVVFTTGMCGYIESLTDPSYYGQILVFTYPLIGNYGVPEEKDWESAKIQVAGVVVSEACLSWSHYEATKSLLEWLKAHNVPVITDVDTRSLTKTLRSAGTMPGAIAPASLQVTKMPGLSNYPVRSVSLTEPVVYNQQHTQTLIAVDCGVKENSIRALRQWPMRIKRVPYDYDYTAEDYDAVFLSNGPGDPTACQETIAVLKKALQKEKPVFGICLGSQLLALAAGAKTYKLPFGHRGHNQPVEDTRTKRCYITSQNHGYAIDAATLPADWEVAFRNLNDGSVEGIRHKTKPFFAVQFHPEAAPGPTDTHELFETFRNLA